MAIKQIIKRDGRIEDFDISKINKWQRWASYNLSGRVQWTDVMNKAISKCPEVVSSQDLQKKLIDACREFDSYPYMLMAGRLYCVIYRKELFNNDRQLPTVKELQSKLVSLGQMVDLGYTDEEYEQIEKFIVHDRDFNIAVDQFEYITNKYVLQNIKTKEKYETPQFMYMRMAMHICQKMPDRLYHVKKFYDNLSLFKINAPSPNFFNLGTAHRGYSSCCLYKAGDTAKSLAIGDHIAYTMTYMSAGIGSYLECRSLGDTIRNGKIIHNGKLPYYKALASAVLANTQGGRGGAATTYFSCYDPEVLTIIMTQNQRTPAAKQNRDIHFAMTFNDFFIERIVNDEDIFTFNIHTAPDLQEAYFKNDQELFKELYNKYLNDDTFKKNFISAKEIAISALTQCHEVSTLYLINISEINRHTPHLDSIYSSNLCVEVTQPTKEYNDMMSLYSTRDDNDIGEISLCSLGGINIANIESDAQYEEAAYYSVLQADQCLDLNEYPWPHLEVTAKGRRNVGIGIIGLAYELAKRGLKYDTLEGRNYIHQICERHAYFIIKASLKLGKELGNAPWMHKTKWPQGWLPIDTYNKNVDNITTQTYLYDWEELRQEIINNGGIRNSSLIAHMPAESSSKATGQPNGVYPIQDVVLIKSDLKHQIKQVAIDNDLYGDKYQIAWDIDIIDMIKAYAVIQKFTDQSISADLYMNRNKNKYLTYSQLLKELLAMHKYGMKTRYYTNSFTISASGLKNIELDDKGCSSGMCTL
jgi:ribonucleoside-diphosphate reductase alpha chain